MINLLKGIHVLGKGPVVILLHSSLSSSKQWTVLVKHLKNEFTVINIDILGYGSVGNAELPDNYKASVEIERIQSALKHLTLEDEPYHIVGHSFGGALGLKLAVEKPSRVLSLSLYEPVPFHLIEEGSEVKPILNELFEKVCADDQLIAAEEFMDYWNVKGFFKSLPLRVQQAASIEMKKVNLDSVALMTETYGANEISKIASPALMMTGRKSPELSQALAEIIMNALDNVRQESFDASHMGVISHADIIQPKIAEFIKNIQKDKYCSDLIT
jgi:pimeloyl-ACP methyl ester carboxylesterase